MVSTRRTELNSNRRDFLRGGLFTDAGASGVPRVAGTPLNGAVVVDADEDGSLRGRVSDEAERIVRNTRHTKYQHKQYIDETTGTYDVDCSDYVSYVLKQVAKRHLDLIPKEDWWPVPRAYKYYRFLHGLSMVAVSGWQQIERLGDAQRGDIIAWELPGTIKKTRDTGHVVMVAEIPSLLDGQLMAVRVFDSAALPHYDDSRIPSGGVYRDGVGSGTIHFRVNAVGQPTAFQFGPGDRFHEYPIAIGRIKSFSES